MSNSVGVSRKTEEAYPTGAPDPCPQFYVGFSCVVFAPGLHSFDYRYKLGSLSYSSIQIGIILTDMIT